MASGQAALVLFSYIKLDEPRPSPIELPCTVHHTIPAYLVLGRANLCFQLIDCTVPMAKLQDNRGLRTEGYIAVSCTS